MEAFKIHLLLLFLKPSELYPQGIPFIVSNLQFLLLLHTLLLFGKNSLSVVAGWVYQEADSEMEVGSLGGKGRKQD